MTSTHLWNAVPFTGSSVGEVSAQASPPNEVLLRGEEVPSRGHSGISMKGSLLVVLATPPLTSGARTLRRVELATNQLGYSIARIANLVSIETQDVNELSRLEISPRSWLVSRATIEEHLASRPAVLLAYGCSLPVGPARLAYKAQLAWLAGALRAAGVDEVITVGGRPRHPSRWQRHTSRALPALDFESALRDSYVRSSPSAHLTLHGVRDQGR